MKYNFGDTSIITSQIKELLHDFNLPMIPVYTDTTVLYDGRAYIKDNKIVKYENGEFTEIAVYNYNRPVVNLTKNFTINSSNYDNYTHKYFGDYLRFMRDYKKLDLMGMYNCFSYEQPRRIYRTLKFKNGFNLKIDTDDNGFIYYVVPVKFNQIYTVAINSTTKFDMMCLFYNDIFVSATSDELIEASYKVINGSRYNTPFLFSTYLKDNSGNDLVKKLWSKEKDLVLLLKLPKEELSTITILEGNYSACSNVADGSIVTKFIYNEDKLPEVYLSKNSLLAVNNRKSYPFADRLVEYIFKNVITSNEEIHGNIERVQDNVYLSRGKTLEGYYGIWDDKLRNRIYQLMFKNDVTKGSNVRYTREIQWEGEESGKKYEKRFIDTYSDLTGYVDRDVESMLRLI